MTHRTTDARWQFSLRSLFGLTLVFAMLFAVARWAELSSGASAVLALILSVALVGGFTLVMALAEWLGDESNE